MTVSHPSLQTGMDEALARCATFLAPGQLATEGIASYLLDEARTSGLRGDASAVLFPETGAQVAEIVRACYATGVPMTPRGGGTGYAGGAIPTGGVVISLERLDRIRSFEPELWRMEVEAGVTTARVRALARENGLFFPPDPGAAEASRIGGNIATNAGGPHAFKYGVTGRWVTGLEVVLPPGELVSLGGPIRKDVAGYDLKSLLIGSEGTLGIVTAAWLSLLPAPELALPVCAVYASAASGCRAIRSVLAAGLRPAALEFLDAGALRAAATGLPLAVSAAGGFLVVAEADGSEMEARALRGELLEALGDGAAGIHAPEGQEIARLWAWRDSVSGAVTSLRGGKLSEDIVVPLDALEAAIDGTLEIGRRHGLEACSWGHAGDGNLHSTFLIDAADPDDVERARAAALDLFDLAVGLRGSISGEHGLGLLKSGELARQWAQPALRLHADVKRAIDPEGLLNPGKKEAWCR